jgi:serine/threonine protein kinase
MNERAIFEAALERTDPEQRAAYLNQACAGNPTLREHIEGLLRAHEMLDSFLVPARGDTLAQSVMERPGLVIGPYKLLQQLGEGGMGTVFMAEQTQPVQRHVALKIIKAGMDSRQVIARFEAERQALALMDHPNIARVLDAGTTSGGRPYFVMELVKGVPITHYCDERRLTPRQRLELFVPVCQAVQHAHQKGIIHRDLKPSNVLVCLYDGKPEPKVIDFGVAKAAGPRLTEKTLFTEVGQVVGTLEYMSPEQAELNQLDVDTRSDVYSLGVLLYELLTGTTPLERGRLKEAAFLEVLRLIREEEPPRPSTRLSTAEGLPSIAASRGVEPKKLSGLMRGELDWIVMKTLEKDRNRRYETANGLAHDIERYLNDEAVQACPPSAWYRLRKLGRRNRAALAVLGMFAAALVVAVAALTLSTVLANQAYQAELGARKQAEADFQHARGAADELFTKVSQSKLFDVPGLQPLRKELLESATRYYRKLLEEHEHDAEVEADLALAHLRLALVYFELGLSNENIVSLNAGLDVVDDLLRRYPNDDHRFRQLGGFWKGTRQSVEGGPSLTDIVAAERTLNRFIQTWQEFAKRFGHERGFQSDLAIACLGLGNLFEHSARRHEAINAHEKSAAILVNLVQAAPDEPEYEAMLAYMYDALSFNHRHEGQHAVADEYADKSYVLLEKLAAAYPKVAQYQSDLARGMAAKAARLGTAGRGKEAENLCRQTLVISEKLAAAYPNVHLYRGRMAAALQQLGRLQISAGHPDDAEKSWRRSVLIEETLVSEFPQCGNYRWTFLDTVQQLAQLLDNTRRAPEAETLLRNAIQVLQKDVRTAPDGRHRVDAHVALAQCDRELGFMLATQDRHPEALSAFHEAIVLIEKAYGQFPNDPTERWYVFLLGETHARLGHTYQALNRFPEAAKEFREAEVAYRKLIGLEPTHALAHTNLAWLLAFCPEPKIQNLRDAVEVAKKAVELAGNDGHGWNVLGVAYYRAGDWTHAIEALTKAGSMLSGDERSFNAFYHAMAQWRAGNKDKAVESYHQAMAWIEKGRPRNAALANIHAEAEKLLHLGGKK